MLYVTTRNAHDVFTANHTLINDRCSQAGLYVPYSLTTFSPEEIIALRDKSFAQCAADILNIFFSGKLGELDFDFCVGKSSSKMLSMNHKIVVAENWHNSVRDFSYNVNKLYGRIREELDSVETPSNWMQVAVRVAYLFGHYSQMLQHGYVVADSFFDVAVSADDFSAPMAAWYARKMGLPIGNIICGCKNDDSLWELLHHRQMHVGDRSCSNIERLIWETMGQEETKAFCDASCQIYEPDEEKYDLLRNGMFAAVVSDSRVSSVIRNVYRSSGYLLSVNSAVAYAGLQDFRASSGEGRTTLILSEQCPVCDCATVSAATGVSELDIKLQFGSV